ncbi:MAG: DUF882 domain-containing protein [Pseudomonadota bacterium]
MFTVILVTPASAETRTLRMYFTHTKESATITFKKNGKYLKSGLRKANRFLRDWRRKEPTRMDPKLLDIVWEIYQKSGSKKPIHVISGYRSPRTNNMLRRRGRGVARNSQHTRGKALDFFLPDVPVGKLRALGLRAHRGGVGFYRGNFIHVDTGRIRHWPKMSRRALSRVFPRGKTVHIPSDGRPLKGYKVAMANLKKGRNADGSSRSIRKRGSGGGSLLASIFKKKEKPKPAAVAKKPKPAKKPTVKVPTPKEVAAKKPAKKDPSKGVDPFAAELATAKKAQEDKAKTDKTPAAADKPAAPETTPEKLVETAVAALTPEQLPLPRPRPAPTVAIAAASLPTNTTALAPATADVSTSSGNGITVGAPSSLTTALRPPADIPVVARALEPMASGAPKQPSLQPTLQPRPALRPSIEVARLEAPTRPVPGRIQPRIETDSRPAATKPTSNQQSAQQIAALNNNILKALSNRRVLQEPDGAVRNTIANELARKLAQSALALPTLRPSQNDLSQDSLKDAAIVTAALDVPEANRVTRPNLRGSSAIQTDNTMGLSVKQPRAVEVDARMQAELRLGNLNGKTVKTWAVVESTRIGPIAVLTAPTYSQSTRRAAPSSVFSHGFGEPGPRLRADRFTGKALTRVAFAHFAALN